MKLNNQIIWTDIAGYTGTYLVESDLGPTKLTDSLFWFMNTDGKYIYYSDQRNRHGLYRLNLLSKREELLLDRPCYGLVLKDDWLFFIDEMDQKLYRCTKDGLNLSKIIDEKIIAFTAMNNSMWYTTAGGNLKRCNLSNMKSNSVLSTTAVGLIVVNQWVIFADKHQNYSLNIYNTLTQTTSTFDEIQASGINTDGRFIYCSNGKDDRSIYRIGIEDNSVIRICGEKTDFLHVIEDQLYFCNLGHEKAWYKMSLHGGQATIVSR